MTMASRHSGQIGQSPHGSRCLASADVSAVGSAGSAEQPAVESAMGPADGTAYGPAQESADQPAPKPAQESADQPTQEPAQECAVFVTRPARHVASSE